MSRCTSYVAKSPSQHFAKPCGAFVLRLGPAAPSTVKVAVSLLVIDDNPGSLELLSSALAQPGLDIIAASKPEDGLDPFFSRRPQIVLTDLVMPHMSGMEVLQRIID